MTPQEEAAAWAEYKSALPNDETWTRLSAEVREIGFLEFLEEQAAHNEDAYAFRCEDTMHEMHTYDVCGECGTIWNRSA